MPRSRSTPASYVSPQNIKMIKALCTPAYIYLIISIIAIVAAMFENAGRTRTYSFCGYTMNVDNTGVVFLLQGIIVVFWTIVLDSLCKNGFSQLSWLLLALPFIGFLCTIVAMSSREGFTEGNKMAGDKMDEEDEDEDDDAVENMDTSSSSTLLAQCAVGHPDYKPNSPACKMN
jgi:hypothetical protein